ncbi:hypothetical protein FACS189459_4430 [Bacilli bacterium]|nr:hypothetical protein FACS189459_4430 [Bacilli bacterium]
MFIYLIIFKCIFIFLPTILLIAKIFLGKSALSVPVINGGCPQLMLTLTLSFLRSISILTISAVLNVFIK